MTKRIVTDWQIQNGYLFPWYLNRGSNDLCVVALALYLLARGLNNKIIPDRVFGDEVGNGVGALQEVYGISRDCNFGPETRGHLKDDTGIDVNSWRRDWFIPEGETTLTRLVPRRMRVGDSGAGVSFLAVMLLGFGQNLNIIPDKEFGLHIEDGVKGFQKKEGLPQTGKVGERFWEATGFKVSSWKMAWLDGNTSIVVPADFDENVMPAEMTA